MSGWSVLGLLGLSVVAFFSGQWWSANSNPFLLSSPHLGLLIALTMFFVGGLLPIDEIREVGSRWPTVLWGTALQYTAMPGLAYAIAILFGFEADLFTGVVMVGCVPGAMASNVVTLLARGNTSYSVCLTTLATLVSPVVVPLALRVCLGAEHEFNATNTSLQLLWQVVLPTVLGFGVCRLSPGIAEAARLVSPFIVQASILWIIAVVVAVNRGNLSKLTLAVVVALLLINGLGYLAGWIGATLGRLDESMRRALTIEIGMQNCGLGTTLVLALFPQYPAAAIPTAAYTFGCMLTGSLLARWWSLRTPIDRDVAPSQLTGAAT